MASYCNTPSSASVILYCGLTTERQELMQRFDSQQLHDIAGSVVWWDMSEPAGNSRRLKKKWRDHWKL